jgi:hypothetical protein
MIKKIKTFFKFIYDTHKKESSAPHYHLVNIAETETGDYIATIQMANKNIVFKTKPEEILANDKLVDQFSSRDIRTLTYLGYLSINSPKYKILARHLANECDKTLFALRKRGEKKLIVKTADEILKEKEILNSLDGNDSHLVGYTIASENIAAEAKMMEELSSAKEKH